MERFHAWSATLRPKDAQAEIEKASIGRQTLDWLLDVDEKTRGASGVDFRLLKLLAHFIIAEGDEGYLWDWMRKGMSTLRPTRDPSARFKNADKYSWIGRLLGAFAEVHLARNPKSADKALQVVVDLCALHDEKPGARAISPASLYVCLTTAFRPGQRGYVETSDALYEKFMSTRCHDGLEGILPGLENEKAILSFSHPRTPDPDALLALYWELESNPQDRLFNPKYPKEASSTWLRCKDLAEMLRKRRRHKDAEWAENFGKRFDVIWCRLSRR